MRFKSVLLLSVLALSACNKGAPDGQVVAKVNGDEITRAELNAELRDVKTNNKADIKAIQNAVLDRLVLQRLVVQAAKQDELDKSQDYILTSRKSNDAILASLFARKVTGGLRTPYASDIQAFINDNPWRFAQREVFLLDQLRMPAGSVQAEWLKPVNTIDEAIAVLNKRGVQFARGRATLDSVTLDRDAYEKISKLAPGAAFASQQGQLIMISAIADRRAAPLAAEASHDVALKLLQQKNSQDALTNRIKALRQAAKIDYQPGFSAPPPPKKGS